MCRGLHLQQNTAFSAKKDTPCDAFMKSNFRWQHRWIPPCGENFDKSFTVPIVPIKLVSAFKHTDTTSPKLEKASLLPGHLCIQEGKV